MDNQVPQQMNDWFQGILLWVKQSMESTNLRLRNWMQSNRVRSNLSFALGLALFFLGIWMFVTFNDGELHWPWKNNQGEMIFPWMRQNEKGLTLICKEGGLHFVHFRKWMGPFAQSAEEWKDWRMLFLKFHEVISEDLFHWSLNWKIDV